MADVHQGWIIGGAAVLLFLLMKGKAGDSVKVQRFAEAIAFAEGFYGSGNPIPRRNNNPGDLKASDVPHVGKDAAGHLIFATEADGWRALRLQIEKIISGASRYSLEMTIATLAGGYAEGSANWARNVSSKLGVSEGTTLREVLT